MVKKKLSLLCLALLAARIASASVDVEVTPRESNGIPVTLRFTLKNEGEYEILKSPQGGADWKVQGPHQITSSQFSYINGSAEQVSSTTLSYLLVPLKTGNLPVPLAQIKVGERVYNSPQVKVRVTRVDSPQAQNRPQIPGFPLFPLEEEEAPPPIDLSPNNQGVDVAVVAEPSKTEVYAGELIVLPFYIYTNENIFRNLEFAAFPTFKDFIKEELYLPKTWRTERVQYRGAPFYKAEVIRFALFPLKSGELLIDPLKMRFELDTDAFFNVDILNKFQGNQSSREDRSLLKSSGSIPVVVKELPPKPASITQSEVAVGQYTISAKASRQDLVQNESFTLKLRVSGTGNIKGIPEPEIKLPPSLQKSRTETDYEVNTMSEGYKDFDLLLVPRSSGELSIPENTWAFFNPDKKAYEEIKIPSIELKIAPSNRKNSPNVNDVAEKDMIYGGTQDFEENSAPAVPLWAWSFPTLVYVFAGMLYVQRRKHESEEALLAAMPWISIERKIYAQQDLSSNQALGLVEAWILSRFRVLKLDEVAFDELAEALKKKTPPEVESKIEKLRELFRQIESARFVGKNTNALNLSFNEIKRLSEAIIHAAQSYAPPQFSDEEEE